ncbi:MAG: apolipoprotein N-acyltransferase [Cyanothece sp. SIO1E1]|nr:apolipoprotein N-acyltransferase [Cyanothece sp. SIO1E1]
MSSIISLRFCLALLGGILMGLTPAPFNIWPLAWVALVPLWVMAVEAKGKRQTFPCSILNFEFLIGLLWGIGYHGLALAWITHLHPLTWMGIPWFGSVAIALSAWVIITLWGAVLVALWAWGMSVWEGKIKAARIRPQKSGFPRHIFHIPFICDLIRVLIGTALWCGLEALWSLGPLYWTSLSYTQSPHNLVILHLGQLSGPFAVTAAIVAVNGCLATAWITRKTTLTPLWSALILFTISHLIGFSLYNRPLMQPPETALRIGMIQGNVPTRVKLTPEGTRRALEGYTEGYRTLTNQGVDAVLTPEGALPILWREPMRSQLSLYQAILERGVMAWVGTFGVEDNRITQSLFTVTGTGDNFSRYNKIKLVPLGEYIPFEPILGKLINRLSPIETQMLPGETQQHFDTPLGQAAVGICYESAYAELFRAQVAAGGQFILTASNNDPYPYSMMIQHHAQDVMRAVETDRWAVRATNTGLSGVVDPHGRTLWMSEQNTYALHAETIARRESRSLYVRWGDWLTPLLLLCAGVTMVGHIFMY